jgi:hypothetical protein
MNNPRNYIGANQPSIITILRTSNTLKSLEREKRENFPMRIILVLISQTTKKVDYKRCSNKIESCFHHLNLYSIILNIRSLLWLLKEEITSMIKFHFLKTNNRISCKIVMGKTFSSSNTFKTVLQQGIRNQKIELIK